MTKYNVKIYQADELVDEQILEKSDLIEFADTYEFADEHWGNLGFETDEGEFDLDDLGIAIRVYADFEEIDGTVESVIDAYSEDYVIEARPQIYLQEVKLLTIQDFEAERFLSPSEITFAGGLIENDLDLSCELDHIFIKVEIRKIED